VHLVSANKDNSSVFKVKNIIVKVDTLKFSICNSKHDLLYKTLESLATALIKKQIQKAIKDSITTGMEYVDGWLVGVRGIVCPTLKLLKARVAPKCCKRYQQFSFSFNQSYY
jgi:predicted KAP-like P-loop ATPase